LGGEELAPLSPQETSSPTATLFRLEESIWRRERAEGGLSLLQILSWSKQKNTQHEQEPWLGRGRRRLSSQPAGSCSGTVFLVLTPGY